MHATKNSGKSKFETTNGSYGLTGLFFVELSMLPDVETEVAAGHQVNDEE